MNEFPIIDCKDCEHCLLKRLTKHSKEFSVMCYKNRKEPIRIFKDAVCSKVPCSSFQPLKN